MSGKKDPVFGYGFYVKWNKTKKPLLFQVSVTMSGDKKGWEKTNAPAGNRTRVCTVAGYYSTTRPLVLVVQLLFQMV
ncbi:hypothetical protein GBA52_010591 [Prunus armeniaca]|nr:hypothetical protein GBA52_010591 [Prunus armeniaca]